MEKFHVELSFEGPDLLAKRGLRNEHSVCSTTKVKLLGKSRKVAEVAQLQKTFDI